MMKLCPGHGPLRAFRSRNFRLFAAGQILSLGGTRIHEVAAGWLMWQLTGSATWLGVLALVEIAPRLVLWPISGLVADSMDRRRVAVIFQTLAAIEACILALLQGLGLMNEWILVLATGLLGLNSTFWQPVRLTLIPKLAPPEDLPNVIALASVLANVARVVGPLVAGPAIIWGGIGMAFALNGLSFVAVVAALLMMDLKASDTTPPGRMSKGSAWQGIAAVAAHPGMRPLFILIGIFAIAVRPLADLLPAFAEGVFNKGPGGFAALISAMGGGALCAGLLLSWRQQYSGLTTILAVFGMIAATATALFALTSNSLVALILMFVVGLGVTGKNIVAQTMVQSGLEDEVRGRVFSFYSVIFNAAPSGGALLLGYVGDLVGIRAPIVVAAVVGLGASLMIFINRKSLAPHLEVLVVGDPAPAQPQPTPQPPSLPGHGAARP
jgi:predicted MFS family arabinose efflux permease